eukprot:12772820-Alexandrium_andersonii.AAC.1
MCIRDSSRAEPCPSLGRAEPSRAVPSLPSWAVDPRSLGTSGAEVPSCARGLCGCAGSAALGL